MSDAEHILRQTSTINSSALSLLPQLLSIRANTFELKFETNLEVVEKQMIVCQAEDEFFHTQPERYRRRRVLQQNNILQFFDTAAVLRGTGRASDL